MHKFSIRPAIEQIAEVLERPGVVAATERFLVEAQRNRLSRALSKMANKEAFVAVVGPQGTGKSSLLNSLLFRRRMLPIGEGTTTNVVCFVRTATGNEEHCEIGFEGSIATNEPLDPATLRKFVDEDENPGNEKGVRFISCFVEADLLHENTVFVDTPGLGSLRSPDDGETMNFARDISLALFLFRTTPTLMASDAAFINELWSICPEFVFVQNVWGESDTEVEAARQHNLSIITDIAKRHGSSHPIVLVPVDVHGALEGVSNNRPELVSASGLDTLREQIRKRIARGGQLLEFTVQTGQVIDLLRLAIAAGTMELVTRPGGSQAEIERLREAAERAEDRLRSLEREAQEGERGFLADCERAIRDFERSLTIAITYVHRQFEGHVASGGDPGIGDRFLVQIREAITDSVQDFEVCFRAICQTYLETASLRIEAVENSLGLAIEDLSGTHVAETVGKGTIFVGATAATALTAISATAFGTALAAGSGVGLGLAAAATAVPVAGWIIAGVVLSVGAILKSVAKGKRKTRFLQAFHEIAERSKKDVKISVAKDAARTRDIIVAELRSRFQAGVRQQEQNTNKIRGNLVAVSEGASQTEETLRTLLTEIEKALAEIGELLEMSKHWRPENKLGQ